MISEIFSNEGQWFWQLVGTIAVVASIFAVYRQVKLQNASHLVNSIESLWLHWTSARNLRLRRQVAEKLLSDESYFGSDSEELLEFFERLGLYVKVGALPPLAVWNAFAWYIDFYFVLTKQGVFALRAQHKDNTLFENFFYLAERMKQISRTRFIGDSAAISPIIVQEFLTSEIATADQLSERS